MPGDDRPRGTPAPGGGPRRRTAAAKKAPAKKVAGSKVAGRVTDKVVGTVADALSAAAPPVPARRPPPAGSLAGLMAAKEIVIACGPGGVGKTTTAAAAAAMAACHHGGRVLVLTVDPAKRLADALGLGGTGIGNTERRIPDEVFQAAGVTPRGELWAAMLDMKESWDALIRQHAPDAETREQILANPLYRNISGRFVQSHDYIAMERLYEIHSTGTYDLIVVDTPPSRNALDFLDAPQRLADFFSSRLLRWLIVPYRSRLVNFASKPFYQVADRILGTQFLADISEFFILFQSMYEGFVERADAVTRLLSDRRTTFMVVSTLEATPVREAEFFAEELVRRRLHLGATVLNRVLPDYFRDPALGRVADTLRRRSGELAEALPTDAAQTRRVLEEVAESFLNFGVVARRESEQRAELSTTPEVLATVPFFDSDIYDMSGLLRLGECIWS
jgi:anion-transporting  ArsA/GET3 family ATPase